MILRRRSSPIQTPTWYKTCEEAAQTQWELRGQRQHVQVHQRDHDEHAPVAKGVDDLHGPLSDTSEQLTHRNSFADISSTEYSQTHILHDGRPELPCWNGERSKKLA